MSNEPNMKIHTKKTILLLKNAGVAEDMILNGGMGAAFSSFGDDAKQFGRGRSALVGGVSSAATAPLGTLAGSAVSNTLGIKNKDTKAAVDMGMLGAIDGAFQPFTERAAGKYMFVTTRP